MLNTKMHHQLQGGVVMEYELNSWLIGGGMILGLIFGAVVQKSGFCMSAVVSNLVLMHDYRQFRALLAAIAIAITGTQILNFTGVVNISESSYLVSRMNWSGAVIGGLIFGFGTILAGGCIGRTVVRVGEGNISSVIVMLVVAIVAASVMYGPLESYRVWLYQSTIFDIPSELASIPGMLNLPPTIFTLIIAALCISIILFTRKNNRSPELLFTGIILGLLIVAGWWITGFMSQDIFSLHRPASLTFAGPLASSSYAIATGSLPGEGAQFGLMLLIGTLLGSFFMAVATKRFRLVKPDTSHLYHIVVGGVLMGIGAIMAGGCNIGNGLTGLSTLSVCSLIAVIAIFTGMRLGIYWLMISESLDQPQHWYSFILREKIVH
jgi:uncharacterized membrane protein YedE/YeeE